VRTPRDQWNVLERMKSDLANASLATRLGELDLDSRKLWECVLDVLDEGVTIHSKDGRVIAANRKAQELAGRSVEELLDHTWEELFETGLSDELPLEKSKDSVGLYPLTNREGSVVGYVRVVPSQTNNGRVQEADLSAEHLATLGQMIGGLAHDLGTPLNIISGYAEYLLMKIGRENAGHKELTAIIQQARRVAEFVKQIVELARPTPGRLETIEVQGFLRSVIDLLGSHLRKTGVEIGLSCRANLPLMQADGTRLKQALFNIVLNGAQAVGAGGELEIIVIDKADVAGDLLITLRGKNRAGDAADFSGLCADFTQANSGKGLSDKSLRLARDILVDLGAKVSALPLDDHGVALAIILGWRSGSRTVSV
jgi:PAS domain S-box-containing protein